MARIWINTSRFPCSYRCSDTLPKVAQGQENFLCFLSFIAMLAAFVFNHNSRKVGLLQAQLFWSSSFQHQKLFRCWWPDEPSHCCLDKLDTCQECWASSSSTSSSSLPSSPSSFSLLPPPSSSPSLLPPSSLSLGQSRPTASAQRVPEPDPLPGISFDTQPDPIQFWKSSGSG